MTETQGANRAEAIAAVRALAAATVRPQRSPTIKTPADYGLVYEETFFP